MSRRRPLLILLHLVSLASLLLPSLAVQAQPNMAAELNGRVIDAETGVPLTGAHVFIAKSMIGTTTDRDGKYSLTGVPTGAHRLYVSMLGFEDDFLDIMLRASKAYTFDFDLTPAVIGIGEIVVEAERDKNWKKAPRTLYKRVYR